MPSKTIELAVYNQDGQKTGTIKLNPAVFGIENQDEVLSRAIQAILANRRQSSAKTKTRAEVSGGGRKPWRQKGTGRARAGSIRSPLWKGGGVVFGPTGEENYTQDLPRKMRRLALLYALSNKVRENKILVLDKIEFPKIKTKQMEEMLNKLPVEEGDFLYLYEKMDPKVYLSLRNLPYLKASSINALNLFDIVKYKWLLIEKETLKKLEARYLPKSGDEK